MIIILNSLLGKLLISTSPSSFPRVLSYSFMWNIFLFFILPNSLCLYLSIGLVCSISCSWKVALYRRRHVGPSSTLPFGHQSYILWGCPHVGCMGPSVVTVPTTVGALVGKAGSQPGWLPGPALCGGWGQVLCWLVLRCQSAGGGAGFQHSWLHGSGCPRAGSSLQVGRVRSRHNNLNFH